MNLDPPLPSLMAALVQVHACEICTTTRPGTTVTNEKELPESDPSDNNNIDREATMAIHRLLIQLLPHCQKAHNKQYNTFG